MYLERLIDFIRYRTYDRYNIIKIHSLEPSYYDIDTRLLHGMFSLLVDYVEIEKANLERLFGDEGLYDRPCFRKWYYRIYRKIRKLFVNISSRDLGLAYLDWEISNLDPSFPANQRDYAKEVKELYLWWVDDYLKREQEEEKVGLISFWDRMTKKYEKVKLDTKGGNVKQLSGRSCYFLEREADDRNWVLKSRLNEEEAQTERALLEAVWKLEQDRFEEDTAMLIRLVNVRGALWT